MFAEQGDLLSPPDGSASPWQLLERPGLRLRHRRCWLADAATIRARLLERHAEGDLVQVAIASGRPHQIRIHCAAVGAPLLGDPLYGPGGLAEASARPGDGGYRLQAWRLELVRPDGTRLTLELPQALATTAPT